MRTPLVCSILVLSLAATKADEQVRATQEELRRRNVYFGDVDGRETPELQEALKRYQKRKGFTASGQKDPDTLRSLGVLPRQPGEAPPKELNWPDEPVLKSDAAVDAPRTAVRVAEESGVAPASVFPLVAISGPGDAERGAGGKPSRGAAAALAKAAREERVQPSASNSGRASAGSPDGGRTLFRADQHIEPREITAFITGYLAAASGKHLQEELRYYADHVDYYRNGTLDRRLIERTLRDYYQHWTKRSYRLAGVVGYRRLPARGEIAVVFRVEFSLKSGRQKVKGQTENRLVINAATSDPRIVSVEERRVRE